jgi:DNA-binding LacI/PurR family transcriptional regulator
VLGCTFPNLRDDAYRATRTLLATHPQITAICATTDEHALGALRAASEAGRRIGDDLALVSIDGTELGAYLTPALTAVTAPFDTLDADAVLNSSGVATAIRQHLLTLTVRRSCGCRS